MQIFQFFYILIFYIHKNRYHKIIKTSRSARKKKNGRISIHRNRSTQKLISLKLIFVKIYLLMYIYMMPMCNYFVFLFGRSWLSTSFHEVVHLFLYLPLVFPVKLITNLCIRIILSLFDNWKTWKSKTDFHIEIEKAKLESYWVAVSSTNTPLTSKIPFKYVLTKTFC